MLQLAGIRILPRLVIGLAVVVLSGWLVGTSPTAADPSHENANPNANSPDVKRPAWQSLSWNPPPLAILRYRWDTEPQRTLPDFDADPLLNPTHYSGSELIATGRPGTATEHFGYEFGRHGLEHEATGFCDLVKRIAFWLPNKDYVPRATYDYDQKFLVAWPFSMVRVKGFLKAAAVDDNPVHPLYLGGRFTFSNLDVPPEANPSGRPIANIPLREGDMRTVITFDRERLVIRKVEIELRYSYDLNTIAATNAFAGWFGATCELEKFELPVSLATLQTRIDSAVTKGVEHLKTIQQPNGSYIYSNNTVGATALALLALSASGVKATDSVMKRGFEFLYGATISQTYDAGLVCMAVEAKNIPEAEWKLARENKRPAKPQRQLDEADRKLLNQAVDLLLANRGVVGVRTGTWNYTAAVGGDHSNTQYAVLGLFSALRCGVKVPVEIWRDVAEHFIRAQEPTGPAVYRIRPPAGAAEAPNPARRSTVANPARGFAYTSLTSDLSSPPTSNPALRRIIGRSLGFKTRASGSMTTAGLACLLMAREGLRQHNALPDPLRTALDQAVFDALAWLQEFFSVTRNPGEADPAQYLYYYLYGLERAGVLAGTDWIGDHHWYREGATMLCRWQRPDGSWGQGHLPDTCFALLFLKRATLPVSDRVWTKE